jgi:protein tyrosine/serine phosphatase
MGLDVIPPAGERHIRLQGSVNFRDLGGYETESGRHTRWRTIFRADGLSRLTPPDRAVIRRLGIATVVDLRTSFELEGGRFPVDDIPVNFHHLPLLDDVSDPEQFKMAPGMLATQYQDMVADAASVIARVLSVLAERQAHPVIVHCTAGKDRTGVLVAVLLGLLGVPDDVIVEDYALSAGAMAALRGKLIERYPEGKDLIEQAEELFSAAPSNIRSLLTHIERNYGSIEGYAASAGVTAETVAALRSSLLE